MGWLFRGEECLSDAMLPLVGCCGEACKISVSGTRQHNGKNPPLGNNTTRNISIWQDIFFPYHQKNFYEEIKPLIKFSFQTHTNIYV